MGEIHDLNIKDKTTDVYAKVETSGALAVAVQDQHSKALDLHFIRPLNAPTFTTLTSAITAGDYVINVTNTTGLTALDHVLCVNPDGTYNIAIVKSIATLALTLDRQLDMDMVVAGTTVIYATANLASVAGTIASPQIYQIAGIGSAVDLDIDITRIMGYMFDSSATGWHDGNFGNISPIYNGLQLRLNNGVITNLWNAKSNGDLGLICFDAMYPPNPPSAGGSFRFRNTYAGQSKHGVVLRLLPSDTLQILVQDDLTGLDSFSMMAQGHIVTD